MELDEYKQNFRPHDVPPSLAKLVAFDADQSGYYSAGFELTVDDKGGMKTWSADAKFLDALFPVAQANGSGSFYALWLQQGGALETAPVVVFGDEGGVHVVAENIESLLRILTFDTEPMIDHKSIIFYRDDKDYEPSDAKDSYAAWLAAEFQLSPVKNADEVKALVKAAQDKFAKPFATWMKQYYDA